MKSNVLRKKEYRPDIDGLRAIAVLAVVLYHAGFKKFSGGYVGVDIFFVISGYLITQLLVLEIAKNGHIDFLGFYLRRLRRLLPALLFTLIATSTAAIFYFTPQRLQNYGASLLHSILSVSNIYFYSESGYFDANSFLKPLLHTWSLGVEEQFYLIWPLMLFFASNKKLLGPILIIVAGLISLYLTCIFIDNNSAAVFFLTPFRVFEFSIGSILVWIIHYKSKYKISLNVLFFLGLSFIIFSIFTYTEKTKFPGVYALVPCIGAALLIYAGKDAYFGRILKHKLLVGIGLISYSFYLVHWPLIVFYKYYTLKEKFTFLESSILVIVSILIAIFMYFYIEKPYRKIKNSNVRFMLISILLSFFVCYIAASMWGTHGWNWRSWSYNRISINEINRGKNARFLVRQTLCTRKGWDQCDKPIANKTNALIVGDSIAIDALNAFYKIFPSHEFSMSELFGCPPSRHIEQLVLPNHPDLLNCKTVNTKRYDIEYLKRFDYIIISVMFNWYTPDHLNEYLKFLSENKITKVVVFGNYFVLQQEMPDLINKFGFNDFALEKSVMYFPEIENKVKQYTEDYSYFFLSVHNAFCQKSICEFFDENGIPFSYDKFHLSYEFSTRIALKEKNNIEYFLSN